ncbi:hypothetical protein B0H13DRAFT_2311817 [Mycena leptocephala]|nr:hypothetical protein B0H13DRAFT_2311817 [Mycena leptocephala]
MSSKSVDTEKPERSRNAKAQARHRAKEKLTSKRHVFLLFLFLVISRVPQLEETAAVLPSPLAKIRVCELEAENARLMREDHDLHRMPPPSAPMLPFDVVPHTRSCDDASPDREYKRRKIDTNGKMERRSTSLPREHAEPPRVLARRPSPPDSPLHPRPHHYDPVTVPVPTNPSFSLDSALHLPDSPRAARPSMTSAITGSRFPSRTHTRMKDATTGTRTGTTSRRRSSSHTRTRPSHQWECA